MRGLAGFGLAWCLVLAGCGTGADGASSRTTPSATEPLRVQVPGDAAALVWGSGSYGLVLLHDAGSPASSWAREAVALAADRMTVVAPEVTSVEALRAAIAWLRDVRKVPRFAVLAAGEASRSVAALGALEPKLIDQAILVSSPANLDWTAAFPKLFAASSDRATGLAAEEAAKQAGGRWNVLLAVGGTGRGQQIFDSAGSADLLNGVLRRLDERR